MAIEYKIMIKRNNKMMKSYHLKLQINDDGRIDPSPDTFTRPFYEIIARQDETMATTLFVHDRRY
jgi:hypothetical protein